MTEFIKLWDGEVKDLAKACVPEPRMVEIMSRPEGDKPTEEEQTYIKEVLNKYKDIHGMYYISRMIWKIEHALADGREEHAKFAAVQVQSVLNSPTYIPNVFKNDLEDEECKTRIALRDGLKRLLSC